jgi:thymidylate synthase
MQNYKNLLIKILHNGEERDDRTNTGTISLFGESLYFDLRKYFPLVTTKKVHWKSIVHELLWFISGETNTKYLNDNGVTIWDEWADEKGDLGRVYGYQWRNFAGQIDQIKNLQESLKNNPQSRRHIVNAWAPQDAAVQALPACHTMFQMYVDNNKRLHCQMYQRSADMFLGVPFNIASYALLTHMYAHVCGLKAGSLNICFGDVHIYKNHVKQVIEQSRRKPRRLPKLRIDSTIDCITKFKYDDIKLDGYKPHASIAGKVAV